MSRLRILGLAASGCAIGAASFAISVAQGGGPGVTPYASGSQQVSSGPGVYDQTTDEYAGNWGWTQDSSAYDYYWYVFHSTGTLAVNGSGHNSAGGGGSWSGAANIYYFKEYNNEPLGSGRVNVLTVTYCC